MSRAASGRASAADARAIAASRPRSASRPPTSCASRAPRQLAVRDDHRGAGTLHEARVGRLVVGGGVRIGHEHGGLAVRGDLEDRAAGARHDQIAREQRLAELRDVAAQVVVAGLARRRSCRSRRSRSPAACSTRNRAPANASHRRPVDRPRALGAAEHEHARLAQCRSRSGPAPPASRWRARGTGRPVTHVARAVATLDREREAHAPSERREQPVGQPEMAVGLGQHERNPREHRGQAHRPGDVAATAEDRRRPQLAARSAAPRAPPRRRPAPARAASTGRPRGSGATRSRTQVVARGRHELELGAVAADERDLGALSPQRVGHRQRRHDVPGGPAGADHDPRRCQLSSSGRLAAALPGGRCSAAGRRRRAARTDSSARRR